MLSFELRISDVGSDRSTNWSTTTAPGFISLFEVSVPSLEPKRRSWKLSVVFAELDFVGYLLEEIKLLVRVIQQKNGIFADQEKLLKGREREEKKGEREIKRQRERK